MSRYCPQSLEGGSAYRGLHRQRVPEPMHRAWRTPQRWVRWAGAFPSGQLSRSPALCLPKLGPHREILGIYARTFQSTSIASAADARKTPSQPLETGSGARKIRTPALIVAFRRAHFEIHAFVDGDASPSRGVATAFDPKVRTQTGISTSG
jgi:hypothetical protein